MLALCLMLLVTYYALNYAGIIGAYYFTGILLNDFAYLLYASYYADIINAGLWQLLTVNLQWNHGGVGSFHYFRSSQGLFRLFHYANVLSTVATYSF